MWRSDSCTEGSNTGDVPLQELLRWMPHGMFEFISLQAALSPAEHTLLQGRNGGESLHTPVFQDAADKAALMACLDAVLAVDSSDAHLAGALGIPTWVLLPFLPAWRWMLERADSPWYASVKLLRQGEDRSWNPLLKQAMRALMFHTKPGKAVMAGWLCLRGWALQEWGEFEQAVLSYDAAIAQNPRYDEAWCHRGNAQFQCEQFEAAVASYDRAIKLRKGYAQAWCNRGLALLHLGRVDGAFSSFSKAVEVQPVYPEASWNQSLLLLLKGNFEAGWPLYEWRWERKKQDSPKPVFRKPLWLGQESLAGKTILLHAEQGFGDCIQFARFAQQVADLGATVVLEVFASLMGVLASVQGVSQLLEKGKPRPLYDYHCPLMSLPLALKTRLDQVPSPGAYVEPDPQKVQLWAGRLGEKKGLRVGLAWSGRTSHAFDKQRSMALSELLGNLPAGLDYVSLQKDVRETDRQTLEQSAVRHFGDQVQDFSDTAALCHLMDVVLSVDTSVVHLAGALGVRTWVMLPFVPDWRWLLQGEGSPWYASVRLYRQGLDKNWKPVFQRVAADLVQTLVSAPNHAEHIQNLFQQGFDWHQQGRFAPALALYETVLQAQPKHFNALHLSGVIALQNQQYAQAAERMAEAIACFPQHPDCYSNLGLALQKMGKLEEAIASHDQAIALRPDFADAWYNRGNALCEFGEFEQSVASFDRAIALQAGKPEYFGNRGLTLLELLRFDAALADYETALRLQPGDAEIQWQKAIALLLTGQYERGWQLYEWRWRKKKFSSPRRDFTQALWLGDSPLQGKTILLHWEQGLGDTIQFCRYIALVAQRGATILLEVRSPLKALLAKLPGVAQIYEYGEALPHFDCHCPLMSLPLAFQTRLDSIPFAQPYLQSDPDKRVLWQKKLGKKTRPRIGLVWSGSSNHKGDKNRSIPLQDWVAQLPPGLDYISLQNEVRDTDVHTLKKSRIRHFGKDLADMSDTAALCQQMDMVLSVDTSVAHLAAALGVVTWVVIGFIPDWRWLMGREDSPWYPSVKLYRQGPDRVWQPVLQRVAMDLAQHWAKSEERV
ncbi:MAG: tetratricopeptide repeat protein [Rhodoferax sp.]|nr:tetratricopeptide repeat protein [Rhodoferax sp.]